VLVKEGAGIEDSLVANGCRVAGVVRRSVLFPGVRVEAGAEVVDSVVMADTLIKQGARVDRAILDKYVRVGEGAVVGYGDPPIESDTAWLDGVALVGKDAVIPEGVKIGRASVIGIGAGPADFGAAEVAAGTLLPSHSWYEDVV
jgi:glucose-1-phosphate adenylyltransferase